jgi:exoribonuclease R
VVTRLVTAPRIDFASLRRELELPTQFPLAAQREADAAAQQVAGGITIRAAGATADRTDIPFVTIDPPTSRDLDQALCIVPRPMGYRVHYAIADVTSFVPAGGELVAETWRRGQTVYLPDEKVPLHPVALSEGAASLLPGETRPAVLWTIDLDRDGASAAVRVERAVVRSRAKLDYAQVQAMADAGTLGPTLAALPELGQLLIARGADRGAINLPIPEQEVTIDDRGHWRLVLRPHVPAEEWNAQISLLTGMSAAGIMLAGGIGLLRTMPAPHPAAIQRLRDAAPGLGIVWPPEASAGAVLASVDPADPGGAAFADHAAELLRGASYTAFDGSAPEEVTHGAVAAPYAHVTAPLRRLADRYAAEVCLTLAAGIEVPQWVREALPELPAVMQNSDRRASAAERGAVDLVESVLLADRVGEEFDAAVVDVDEPRPRRGNSRQRPPGGIVALDDPPVWARCLGKLPLGQRIRVRLSRADPGRRMVEFELA